MAKKRGSSSGKKALLLIMAFILACIATYAMFLYKVNSKIEAMEIVQRDHLPKDSINAFLSKMHQEGKFKLLGWDIDDTDEKGVYIVSYTVRRLNDDGFKVGDPIGYWFRVDPKRGLCEGLRPDGTITPE
ncbi:MAG: hypothetical protein RQ767_06380 [Thermovirgaceae bacterium]|nr:hypothetical protein [Thermovirgaceae bacterium]